LKVIQSESFGGAPSSAQLPNRFSGDPVVLRDLFSQVAILHVISMDAQTGA
jgi:hypothetical protein